MHNDLIYLLTVIPIKYLEWLKIHAEDLLPIITLLFLGILILLEMMCVRGPHSRRNMIQSYLANIATFMFNNFMLSMLSFSSLLVLAENYNHYGLLSVFSQPVQVFIAFILFDLILYLWHKANHDFDWLWGFHKIHHSDQSMNVSTAFRVHFIEVFLTTLVKAVFIIITGLEAIFVALIEGVLTLFVMFHHLNINFRSEKWLKWFVIVPSLHRVHHATIRKDHDSNYGAVFSLWDRLFWTYTEAKQVEVGLVNVKALNFYELLKFGWLPDKSVQVQLSASSRLLYPENFRAMIAEAAYYNAEKRGFEPGYEVLDWFEAEQQISQIIA